ncbi:MAG: hypothetical protein ACRD63_17605 [Pyrinomonadaceae bacterium]
MSTALLDEERLKELFKSAIVEVLEERKDLALDLYEEALEDIALTCAIEEGEHSKNVSRTEIFKVLEGDF